MRGTTGEETKFTDDTGVYEGPMLSILIKNMIANHRQYRHDRHPDEEVACLSRFLGDGNRDGEVMVAMEAIVDRHAETP